MITELLSLALGVIIVFYIYLTWDNDYWKKKGVPCAKPVFFFGNYKEALTGIKHIGIIQTELYNKFKNVPYVGYFKLNTPVLLLRDPELVKNVLVKDFSSFTNNDFQVDPDVDPIWATNPFSKRDDAWKTTRGQWSSSLTQSKIKGMYGTVWEKGNAMVDYIRNHIKEHPNQPLEAREMSAIFFTDVIVSAVFGLKIDSWKVKDNPFRKITSSLFQATFWDGLITMSFVVAPWLGKFFKLRFVPKATETVLRKIAQEILSPREGTAGLKNDIYEIMKKHNEFDAKNETSVTELAGRFFGFLLDGTETSSGVLGFLIFELASNPDIQSKLRDELDRAAPKGEMIPFDDIIHLPYLDMVFSETLRMYPASLAYNRMCGKEYQMPAATPGGRPVTIPVGMIVTIPVFALHRDPEYFPDPEKFDPERFSAEGREGVGKFTYLPFGEGPRICIGAKLGTAQTKVAIAHILRNFEIRVSPDSQQRPVLPDPNVFVYRAVGKLLINFYQRS